MKWRRITEPEQLRRLYGAPVQRALDKVARRLHDPHRRFIARSPFLVIGSQGLSGGDVSPRGDEPGFVKIIGDSTLVIPDRVGNRRIDTMLNILANPKVALIFFIPGLNETLRVNGRAFVTEEPTLLMDLAHGKTPALAAIIIEIDEVFHQCVRALRRSELWDPSRFVEADFPRISTTPEVAYDGKLY